MKVRVEDGKLKYRKMLKKRELPLDDLKWAYLQMEDVSSHVCCGEYACEIGRVVVMDKAGKKEVFQFDHMGEGMKIARKLLHEIQKAKPDLAIGYTEENRAKFEPIKS